MLLGPDLFFFHTDGHGLSRVFSLCPELSNYRIFLFTRNVTEYHGYIFLVPNYRIIEFFFFTRNVTDYHGFSLSRIIELSNFSFSHGMSRSSHGLFLSRIIELSNFFSHGVPRRVTDIYFLSRIIELSNFFSHGESRIYFFCHEFANSKIRDKEKHP